jgi:uncharacterized protein YjbJ (UPF0337 family)
MFPTDEAWYSFAQDRLMNPPGDGPSPIARLIESGEFSETQLNEIIARATRDPGTQYALLGNDSPGFSPLNPSSGDPAAGERVIRDQEIIAPALDSAFRAGAIGIDDLKALGEGFGGDDGFGEERVAALLGRSATGPGSPAEAYALSLLEPYQLPTATQFDEQGMSAPSGAAEVRAQGLAFSMLANDPALREKHFSEQVGGTSPRYALETLVNYNDQNRYNPGDPALISERAAQGLTAAASIYTDHSTALLDQYTGAGGKTPNDMPELARFWAQTSIDPYARDLQIPDSQGTGQRPLYEAVNAATYAYVGEVTEKLESTVRNGGEQHNVLDQLGAMQAGMNVSVDIALTRYQESLSQRQETIDTFASAGEQLAGSVPTGRLPLVGGLLEHGGNSIGGWVGESVVGEKPEAPYAPDGGQLVGDIRERIGEAEGNRSDRMEPDLPDMQGIFDEKTGDREDEIRDGLKLREREPVSRTNSTPEAGREDDHASLPSDSSSLDGSRFAGYSPSADSGGLTPGRDQPPIVAAAFAGTIQYPPVAQDTQNIDNMLRDPMYGEVQTAMQRRGIEGDPALAANLYAGAKHEGLTTVADIHPGKPITDADGKPDRNFFIFDGKSGPLGPTYAMVSENQARTTPMELAANHAAEVKAPAVIAAAEPEPKKAMVFSA